MNPLDLASISSETTYRARPQFHQPTIFQRIYRYVISFFSGGQPNYHIAWENIQRREVRPVLPMRLVLPKEFDDEPLEEARDERESLLVGSQLVVSSEIQSIATAASALTQTLIDSNYRGFVQQAETAATKGLGELEGYSGSIVKAEELFDQLTEMATSNVQILQNLPLYWQLLRTLIRREVNEFNEKTSDKTTSVHKRLAGDLLQDISVNDPGLKERNPSFFSEAEEMLPRFLKWILASKNEELVHQRFSPLMTTLLVSNLKGLIFALMRLSSADPKFRGDLSQLIDEFQVIFDNNREIIPKIVERHVKLMLHQYTQKISSRDLVDLIIKRSYQHVLRCQENDEILKNHHVVIKDLEVMYKESLLHSLEIRERCLSGEEIDPKDLQIMNISYDYDRFQGSIDDYIQYQVAGDLLDRMFQRLPGDITDMRRTFVSWFVGQFKGRVASEEELFEEMVEKLHGFFQDPVRPTFKKQSNTITPIHAWHLVGVHRSLFFSAIYQAFMRQSWQGAIRRGDIDHSVKALITLPNGKVVDQVRGEAHRALSSQLMKLTFPQGIVPVLERLYLPTDHLNKLLDRVITEAGIDTFHRRQLRVFINESIQKFCKSQTRSLIRQALSESIKGGADLIVDGRKFYSMWLDQILPMNSRIMADMYLVMKMKRKSHYYLERKNEIDVIATKLAKKVNKERSPFKMSQEELVVRLREQVIGQFTRSVTQVNAQVAPVDSIPFMSDLIKIFVELGGLEARVAKMVISRYENEIAQAVSSSLSGYRDSYALLFKQIAASIEKMGVGSPVNREASQEILTEDECQKKFYQKIKNEVAPQLMYLLKEMVKGLPLQSGFIAEQLLPSEKDLSQTLIQMMHKVFGTRDKRALLLYSIMADIEKRLG